MQEPSSKNKKGLYRLRRADPHERLSARLRHFSFGAAVVFVVAAAGDRFVRARLYLTPQAVYSQIAQGPMSQLGSPLVAQFFDALRFG